MMGNEAIHDAHLKQAERQRDEARAEVERLRGALEKIAVDGPTNPTRADIAREALDGKESR